jgi:hypothetical protein
VHAKHRILRFSLGGHPPAGAALGILPRSTEAAQPQAGAGLTENSLVASSRSLVLRVTSMRRSTGALHHRPQRP